MALHDIDSILNNSAVAFGELNFIIYYYEAMQIMSPECAHNTKHKKKRMISFGNLCECACMCARDDSMNCAYLSHGMYSVALCFALLTNRTIKQSADQWTLFLFCCFFSPLGVHVCRFHWKIQWIPLAREYSSIWFVGSFHEGA